MRNIVLSLSEKTIEEKRKKPNNQKCKGNLNCF